MFELPRYVIKQGEIIVEDGDLRQPMRGASHYVQPEYDRDFEPELQAWFEDHYSVQFSNYPVRLDELDHPREVRCRDRDHIEDSDQDLAE